MVSLNPNVSSPHSFGVSFTGTGTVSLGDSPWPASEPLPPPEVPFAPAVAGFKPPVALLPPPPPPPYVAHPAVGPLAQPQQVQRVEVLQQQQSPPFQVQPVGTSSPQSSSASVPQPHQAPFLAYNPFPAPAPWLGQGMPSPYAGYGSPTGMPGAPSLTPWSPVPLRSIDEFVGGTWAPGQAPYSSSPPQPPLSTVSDASGRRRASSSVASTTTGQIEYPISAARSAAAHAAAEATRAAQIEHAAANAQYQQQQQQQGGAGQASVSSSLHSDLGSFSMASMSGWPAAHPTPQQVQQAQQAQQQLHAHQLQMQQQHLQQLQQMHAHAQMQHAHEQQQQQMQMQLGHVAQHQYQDPHQSSSPPLHPYSTTHTPPSDAGADPRTSSSSSPRVASPELCAVAGCARPVFCELSPCGDRLCRDHLGWVIRGARTVEVDEAAAEGPSGEPTTTTTAAAPRIKKLFRCVACRVESSMAGPTSSAGAAGAKSRRPSEPVVGLGLSGVDLPDDSLHAFSIKYFSSGPAPFLHPAPASPTSAAGTSDFVDLSTALDPAGDASLVQHVRFPSSAAPGVELQPAPTAAQLSFVQAQAQVQQDRPHLHGVARALSPLDIELARSGGGAAGLQRVPRPPSPPFRVGSRFLGPEGTVLAEAQPFLFQAPGHGDPHSASPGPLTPTEKASSCGSERGESLAEAEAVVRPSSAQPALEGASSSPITTSPTRRRHEHKRSLSRSVTSPAAMYAPNPLEAALDTGLHVPRRVLSPPGSPRTPSPVRREGRPVPYPSPEASTRSATAGEAPTPDRRGSLGHAMLQPDFAFPAPHHLLLLQQQQQQQQQQRTPPRGFTQSTYLPSPYPSMPVPPMPPFASFPPGSVSVQPQHAQHYSSMGAPGAFARTFVGPQSTPMQRGGKKRGSLPASPMIGLGGGLGGFQQWVERVPGSPALAGGRSGLSSSATFPPRQAATLDPMEDGAKLEQGGWPLVKVENVRRPCPSLKTRTSTSAGS